MLIIAHRGNQTGPQPLEENREGPLDSCLSKGWAVETDIRRGVDGRFYISHDPAPVTEGNEARTFLRSWRRWPGVPIALNVKECGYEADLIRFLAEENVLSQLFLFDMELVENVPGQMAQIFRRLSPSIRLAARVSDRREPLNRALAVQEADVIWLDEFDHQWARSEDIRRLKNAGKTVHAVSPDLHGFSLEISRRRWSDFISWGVDGICTDYPAVLEEDLHKAGGERRPSA